MKMSCVLASISSALQQGEGGGHRGADAAAAEHVEDDAALLESLEDADMGGTEGAAAAGDEAGRPSRHEPQEAAEIVAVLHRQMMGGRRLAQGEPLRSRLDGADTARMEANQPPPRRRKELERKGFGLARRRRGALGDQQQLIGRADRGVRPGGQSGVGDADDEIVLALDAGQPVGDGVAVGLAIGEMLARVGAGENAGAGPRARRTQSGDERLGRASRPGADHRHGARGADRPGDPGAARPLGDLGEAPGQRSGDRPPHFGKARGQRVEPGPADLEHFGIARRDDLGAAPLAGEKADLADELAGADFGDDAGLALDLEQTEIDDEQNVRGVAFLDQRFAAADPSRAHRALQLEPLPLSQVPPKTFTLEQVRMAHRGSPSGDYLAFPKGLVNDRGSLRASRTPRARRRRNSFAAPRLRRAPCL